MEIEGAIPNDPNSKSIQLWGTWQNRARLSLVALMYLTLFLPWWDSRGTDLQPSGCPPDCPPASGFWMWLAAAGWLLCCPAIPLVTVLPSAIGVTARNKQVALVARGIYFASLLVWLLMTILFATLNASMPADKTTYMTPYLGLALAVAAVTLEAIDLLLKRSTGSSGS
jgi:hypothetical protein